ncbi:MAG: histidine kinase [Bacteroidales bacterium]|nr:histidine kinase [Bacteroidales bacterium]
MKTASRIKEILLLFLLILLLFPGAKAQFPLFTSIAGKDQLKNGSVTRVLQDSRGFIWLGTSGGLFVYDGFDFRELSFSDSLKTPGVTALALDKSGQVWVGFSNGKIAHGHENGFSFFAPEEGLPAVAVTSLMFDNDSTLWISTYGEGVYYYRNNRLFNINADDGLGDNYVYTLSGNADGTIWAGNDAGISICSHKGNRKVIRHFSTMDGLPDIIVQKIVPAVSGGFWIGMQEKGICYYNPVSNAFELPFSQNWDFGPVNDILDFGDLLWIATEGNGIVELSLKKVDKESGFSLVDGSGKRIECLLHDLEGNVWIVSHGLLSWSSGPGIRHYKNIAGLNLGNIHALHAEQDGSLYFGNDQGFFYFNSNEAGNRKLKQLLPPQSRGGPGITSIYHDPADNIWVGTFGNGLYRIDKQTGVSKKINDPLGRLNNNILGISGKGEEIWFATLGGAARCSIRSGSDNLFDFDNFSTTEGLGNNFIYTVLADKEGRIWFGTDGKGPAVYKEGRFAGFGAEQGMPARVIYSITEDSDDNIWLGSANEGIFRYNGSEFTRFDLSSGLRNLKITSLISGNRNQVVVVHNDGVDLVNSRTGQVSYLGIEAGISAINADLNAAVADSSGSVWFGTHDGIIHYSPDYLNAMAMPVTSVRRVSVYLSEEEASPGDVFAYNQNHLSFEYIGIWYNKPAKVTYRVRLDGHDPDWVSTGDRKATYSNLPPGKYTFRVQSSVNDDFTYAMEASFDFSIRSPFYSRWWFILAVVIILAASAFLIIRSRLNRVRREQQLLKEKAESQFQLLRSQVNPHFLFNNFSTLMAIIEEDKDLAIEYVGKLSAFFRYILEYRDKELIPLSEEMEIVENYIFLQKKRYGDNLAVHKEINPAHLSSLIPPLTLQLLLENAVKHNIVSSTRPLVIRVFSEFDFLVIENAIQPRKTPETSTGMGLQNIKSRYRIFTAKEIVIEQTDNYYKVFLPLIFP